MFRVVGLMGCGRRLGPVLGSLPLGQAPSAPFKLHDDPRHAESSPGLCVTTARTPQRVSRACVTKTQPHHHPQPLASQRRGHPSAPRRVRHKGPATPAPSTPCVTIARTPQRAPTSASQRPSHTRTLNPLRHNGANTPARPDECVTKTQPHQHPQPLASQRREHPSAPRRVRHKDQPHQHPQPLATQSRGHPSAPRRVRHKDPATPAPSSTPCVTIARTPQRVPTSASQRPRVVAPAEPPLS